VTIAWEAAGATDVGRVRNGNEDAFRFDSQRGVFLVADGMGGHAAGEVASALAADAVVDLLRTDPDLSSEDLERDLVAAFDEAHRRIVECCNGDPQTTGMGTTLTAAALRSTGDLHIGHIGDSRVYLRRGGELLQVTHDHTWVQQELDAGRISPDVARTHPLGHILTRVLTADEPAAPDVYRGTVYRDDTLLLCSDGLYNMVDGQSLLDLLTADHSPETTVERLIATANRRGGTDNITAIVVRIL
jgi:PPM family protein phosphatase